MTPHAHGGTGLGALWPAVAIGLLAAGYVLGWRRLGRSSHPIPAWRALSFHLGLACAGLALAPPIGDGDGRHLVYHMVQHLLLMTVAPPLIFLGEPVLALRRGWSHETIPPGDPRRRPALGRLVHPAVCWLAATVTLIAWHIPALFGLALRSPAWHAVEQASFLVSGLLFWWPVVQPWPSRAEPRWSTVLYLFLATLPCDILAGFLVFSDRIAYSIYLGSSPGVAVLEDQQCAGAVMWTCVTLIYLVAGAIVSMQLLVAPAAPSPHAERVTP
ncbi:MAG TPA: cytochrome c oxidase assembly protein [Candidatus Polarisedimenticolia bacterium]|nr:cytochrome c oxidase assembly protein [Candidatus Polarisedimenticolia bacterium]